ncbi:MAG: HlyD family efflux transporter periplasmic adaptor subunit [Candidatus Manganitrophaceae bacterium]|nr:MAG: HlyD family efflux transporter periplasmic adaptor subunit [Candidatus Manganitrophaceae bacterium]
MKAKTLLVWLVVLIFVAVAGWGAWRFFSPPPLPEGILEGHGRIEGTEIAVSGKITGRIAAMGVKEGERVEKGTEIARLSADEIEARLSQAQARAEAAERQVTQLSERVKTLAHHAAKVRVDHERNQALFRQGVLSKQQFDRSESALKEAEGELRATEALLAASQSEAAAAQAIRREAEAALSEMRITAPITGTIVTKAMEEGELALPGRTLVTLVDLTHPYLRVYLPEREIGKVKLGDPARVFVDSFPNRPFEAEVTEVAQKAEFTPKDVHMPDERVTLVYGVKLQIKNPQGFLKPGMPADALIKWKPETPWTK